MILNVFFSIVFSTNFEEYEGIFSTFVQGVYTTPSIKEWNVDVHFFLYALYAYINQFFPNIQIYGLVLVLYNWISLIFLGLVLYRILLVNLKKLNWFIFILLYIILSVDNIVNLSTNRIAFTFLATAFAYIESNLQENKIIKPSNLLFFILIVLFAALLRFDFAILASIIYLIFSLFNRSVNRYVITALVISIVVTVVYNIVMQYMSEARQIYYYKELDFIMRNNFNYDILSSEKKIEVDAFFHYIFDEIHLTWNFYNDIAVHGKGEGVISLFFGLHFDAFINTFDKSIVEYKMAWYFILYSASAGFMLAFNQNKRMVFWCLHLVAFLMFPLLVCFYVVTPLRFLVPYYSIIGTFYVIIYMNFNRTSTRIKLYLSFVVIIILFFAYNKKKLYSYKQEVFVFNQNKLKRLESLSLDSVPIVINNFDQTKFFPISPMAIVNKQEILFQNLYYFMSYDCFIDKWKEVCNCNPLSLYDKIDYVVKKQNLFIVDEERFNYLCEYFFKKYHMRLQKTFIQKFDEELNVYRLSYVN
jgi:hypothetical protein